MASKVFLIIYYYISLGIGDYLLPSATLFPSFIILIKKTSEIKNFRNIQILRFKVFRKSFITTENLKDFLCTKILPRIFLEN